MSKIEKKEILTKVFRITDDDGNVTIEKVKSESSFKEIEPKGEAWNTLELQLRLQQALRSSSSDSSRSSTSTERSTDSFSAETVDHMLSMQSRIHKKGSE